MMISGIVVAGLIGLFAFGQARNAEEDQGESEREVDESQVPAAALKALRALAGDAKITEFAEEIEHGHTFYEGSWKGPNGNFDALVTEFGDLVEIEETVPGESVPQAVRAKGMKTAGPNSELTFEKKTLVMYELHFHKNGKEHELILTPDARVREEDKPGRKPQGDRDDDDDEDEDDDDND